MSSGLGLAIFAMVASLVLVTLAGYALGVFLGWIQGFYDPEED